MITWRNAVFFLISSMLLSLLDQLHIFLQLYLIRVASFFNKSGATWPVALDISEAFDRVWHAGHLHKLRSYGIWGWTFDYISFSLGNIQLWVVLDGNSSQKCPVNAGAPKGTIYGPMLASFLVISDLPDVICNIATYADDTGVLARPYLMVFCIIFCRCFKRYHS